MQTATNPARQIAQHLGVSQRAAKGFVAALQAQMRSGGSTDEAVARLLKNARADRVPGGLCEQITTERGLCLLIVA